MEPENQGYNSDRFVSAVGIEYQCTICLNVLKDPVQCRENEHHFCKSCITRYIQRYSRTCPECRDELNVETLAKPSRYVVNVLSNLRIKCDYADRGCREVVSLEGLETHVKECNFSPVECPLDGCTMIIDKQDKKHHETKVCGFRKMKCDACGEVALQRNFGTHGCVLRNDVDEINLGLAEMRGNLEEAMEEMRGSMDVMKEELKRLRLASEIPPKRDIVVAGGYSCDNSKTLSSSETFGWSTRTWEQLPSMTQPRQQSSSFAYRNEIIVSGGKIGDSSTDKMERVNPSEQPNQWLDFPAKLPFKCHGHTSNVYKDRLIVIGGYNADEGGVSDGIYEVRLTAPHTSRLLFRMATPRTNHCAVMLDGQIWILGGTTTGMRQDSLNSVVRYDAKKKHCEEMPGLSYAVSCMAAVAWRDNVIVIGGYNTTANECDTVLLYRVETGKCEMLPKMRHRRFGCAAVVTGNEVVVMGGCNHKEGYLDSVECSYLDQYQWLELPPLKEPRYMASAAVI